MEMLYRALICFLLVWVSGCATPPPQRGFELPPALREIYRGGELKPMQDATSPDLGFGRDSSQPGYVPTNYDLVSHTCTSEPIFNIDGSYWRTITRCF